MREELAGRVNTASESIKEFNVAWASLKKELIIAGLNSSYIMMGVTIGFFIGHFFTIYALTIPLGK